MLDNRKMDKQRNWRVRAPPTTTTQIHLTLWFWHPISEDGQKWASKSGLELGSLEADEGKLASGYQEIPSEKEEVPTTMNPLMWKFSHWEDVEQLGPQALMVGKEDGAATLEQPGSFWKG